MTEQQQPDSSILHLEEQQCNRSDKGSLYSAGAQAGAISMTGNSSLTAVYSTFTDSSVTSLTEAACTLQVLRQGR